MKKENLIDLFCLQAQYEGQKAWCEDYAPEDVPVIDAEINYLNTLIEEHLERNEPKP